MTPTALPRSLSMNISETSDFLITEHCGDCYKQSEGANEGVYDAFKDRGIFGETYGYNLLDFDYLIKSITFMTSFSPVFQPSRLSQIAGRTPPSLWIGLP